VDEAVKPIKVDLKLTKKLEGAVKTIEIYGLPINVPTLTSQLKMKLKLNRKLERDDQDALNLLGVYYLNKGAAGELVHELDKLERRNLYRILTEGFIKEEVLIEPDKRYVNRLKSVLRAGL
jgi:hypothetical protein